MSVRKVAILTAGGFAPCLSSAMAGLVERYSALAPEVELIAYRHGYQGLLTGDFLTVTPQVRERVGVLHRFGGSPIGNSRVKLTNHADLVQRGLCPEGADPLEFAAQRLIADGVDVLHTIGGDDTNTTAADLAAHIHAAGHELVVVGLPKTIDNDIVPVAQSLGAQTAAEMGARFASNVLAEHNAASRMLIIHEVMGRNCGWLTAATARAYRHWLDQQEWLPEIGLDRRAWDIHGIFLPETEFDVTGEVERLTAIMDEVGNVNLFVSEGAGIDDIIEEMEKAGEPIPRDAFGHVRLNDINPGQWFGKQFAKRIGAAKTLVQKSGYYSRSAAANEADLALIAEMTELAVSSALAGTPGVVGHDEERGGELRVIEFDRIAGHKPFDFTQEWYRQMCAEIGMPEPIAQFDDE